MNAPTGNSATYGSAAGVQSFGGPDHKALKPARQQTRKAPQRVDAPLGLGARVGTASAGLRSTHGAMLGALLRAPPRKAVRKYVVVELEKADGRRMEYGKLVERVSCMGYDHAGRSCGRHGKNGCGGWEWVTDVDGAGNIVGEWERKLGVATPYELAVAIDGLLEVEVLDVQGGQLRLCRRRRSIEPLTREERWRREDEELRAMWQTIEVHETRGVYVFE